MKLNTPNEMPSRTTGSTLKQACFGACEKMAAQVARVKETIFAESRAMLAAPERMLKLALNEAEAVAWQTDFPHLFFPVLAVEKVRGVAAWNHHQTTMRSARNTD